MRGQNQKGADSIASSQQGEVQNWKSLWANRVLALWQSQAPLDSSWEEENLPVSSDCADGLLLRFIACILPPWVREQVEPQMLLPWVQSWLQMQISSLKSEEDSASEALLQDRQFVLPAPLAYSIHYLLSPSVIPGWYEWTLAPWEKILVSKLQEQKIVEPIARALWVQQTCSRHLTIHPIEEIEDSQSTQTPQQGSVRASVGLFPPKLYPSMQQIWDQRRATELEGAALLCRALRSAGFPARVLQAYGSWREARSWVEFWDGRRWRSLQLGAGSGVDCGSHRFWGRRARFISVDLEIPLQLYRSFPLKDVPQVRGGRGLTLERTRRYTQTTCLRIQVTDPAGAPLGQQSVQVAMGTQTGLLVFSQLQTDALGWTQTEIGLGYVVVLWGKQRIWIDTTRTQEVHITPAMGVGEEEGETSVCLPGLERLPEVDSEGEKLDRSGEKRAVLVSDSVPSEDPMLHQPQIRFLLGAAGLNAPLIRAFLRESETGYDLANRLQWLLRFDAAALSRLERCVLEDSVFSDSKRPLYRLMTEVELEALWGQAFADTIPTAWRSGLRRLLEEKGLAIPSDMEGVLELMRSRFTCTGEGCVSTQLSPECCFRLGLAEGGLERGEWERLTLALLRLAGVAARHNPWTQELEWFDVDLRRYRCLDEQGIWFPNERREASREPLGFCLVCEKPQVIEGDMQRLLREKREEEEAQKRAQDPAPLMEVLPDSLSLQEEGDQSEWVLFCCPVETGQLVLFVEAENRWALLPIDWQKGQIYILSERRYLLRLISDQLVQERLCASGRELVSQIENWVQSEGLKQIEHADAGNQ